MSTRWPLVRLGEVVQQVSRPELVDISRAYRLLGVRLDGRGPFLRETVTGAQTSAARLSRVETGDFIYSRLFAWRGAFGIVGDELDGCYVSNEFPTFRANPDRLDAVFLDYWFRLPATRRRVEHDCSGSTPLTRNRFNERFFLTLDIPLPPVPEQRRIVRQIDAITTELRNIQAAHQLAADEIATLDAVYADEVFAEAAQTGPVLTVEDVCTTVTDGDHNTPTFTDSGIPFIFVGNVSSGSLHFEGAKRVSAAYFAALKPHRVPSHEDILYSAVGATLGIPAIVEGNAPFCFQRHIAILKPNRERIVPRFLWHMLRSRTVTARAWQATTGSAQPTIPLRAIRSLPVPLPPVREQRKLIAKLDQLRTEVAILRHAQAQATKDAAALLPALLRRAFA